MRAIVRLVIAGTAAAALQGCLAKTALDVATLPVKVASRGVDLATTSQSEIDQKRGRELREREERIGKLERTYYRQYEDCEDGDREACLEARATWDELQALRDGLPPPPPPDRS